MHGLWSPGFSDGRLEPRSCSQTRAFERSDEGFRARFPRQKNSASMRHIKRTIGRAKEKRKKPIVPRGKQRFQECRQELRGLQRSSPHHPAAASAGLAIKEFTAGRSRTANIHLTELRGEHTRRCSVSGRSRLPPLFFLHPFDEERLKFRLRINAFMDQQRVHRVYRGLETFIPRGCRQSFFERHVGYSPRPSNHFVISESIRNRIVISASPRPPPQPDYYNLMKIAPRALQSPLGAVCSPLLTATILP